MLKYKSYKDAQIAEQNSNFTSCSFNQGLLDSKMRYEFPSSETPIVQSALNHLKTHFINIRGNPIRTPYFLKQLQVLYETDYFPWVVSDALKLLESQKIIQSFTADTLKNKTKLKHVHQIKFFVNSLVTNNPTEFDRIKNKAYNISKLVNEYSNTEITSNVGEHLQMLVWYELRAQGFKIVGKNTNKYQGKVWNVTGRNLDFIAEHNSGKLTIGVEVKNTLDLIPITELVDKIAICKFLGVTPVFAVRWNKPYIENVRKSGGYSWIFKAQIYPKPYHELVKRIFTKLSVANRTDTRGNPLKFPIIDRNTLPEKSVVNFQNWVTKMINS